MQAQIPRDSERSPKYLPARVILNNGNSSADAVVRNLSRGGARLQIVLPLQLPFEFDLLIGNPNATTIRRRARRVWTKDSAMGVAFVAATARTH